MEAHTLLLLLDQKGVINVNAAWSHAVFDLKGVADVHDSTILLAQKAPKHSVRALGLIKRICLDSEQVIADVDDHQLHHHLRWSGRGVLIT